VGEFHPDPRGRLADRAVAGDGQRLWLVSLATGRPVEPLLVNCVRLPNLQQPLIRFLTEIWTAWTAPCARFNWGHAHTLPFLPRLRRGRAILHPARWTIPATTLPGGLSPWPQWHAAWQQHRERHRLPRHVLVGQDDIRLHLDLDETTHLALLRSHLDRHPRAALTEAPEPAGWIDGRPAELLLTLAQSPPAHRPARRQPRPASTLAHRPGRSQWLDARLYGLCEHLVARVSAFADPLAAGWWFLRYPHHEPHVRLRIPLRDTAPFAAAARDLAGWAQQLRDDGLLTDYTLATYRPETRWGHGSTLAAAEAVFAADSQAVCQRLSGDRQATTAAGMITIVRGFTGSGPDWLVDRVPHGGGSRLDPAQLAGARLPYEDESLATALSTYRTLAERDGLDADQLLADLLHLHHARMIGVDIASERHCLRLARAVVHADLVRRAS
jgi:hypothetical protein